MGKRRIMAGVVGVLVMAACSGGDDAERGSLAVDTVATTTGTEATTTSTTTSTTTATTAGTVPDSTQPSAGTSPTVPLTTASADGRRPYAAEIRRTEHNIPHITADDMGSLGYGYGYAIAEDHACTIADAVVQARGEAASFFGAGPDDQWLNQDLAYASLQLYERATVDFDAADTDLQDTIRGYAAGFNRYLADTTVAQVPGYCAGQPWVRPIDEYDLSAYYKALSWRASVDPLKNYIATAQPPDPAAPGTSEPEGAAAAGFAALTDHDTPLASNAWAIGPDRTEEGTTMLMGNPHFPWQGTTRFYEVQLTVPGEMNVYGVSLIGVPAVNIGFTDGVAWSHTVSAGRRFTAYTLDLVPGDPTRYYYDGEERAMTSSSVAVDVLGGDGTTTTIERTLWSSHYGPIIDFPGLGWTDDLVLSFRDANADNDEQIPQFAAMNRAEDMDDLIAAHADHQGIPWVNTIAASADGRIWYADASASPNLSKRAIDGWQRSVADGGLAAVALDNRVILLDGSDSRYEWVDDPDARDPGVVAFGDVPQLERTDVLFNANDPYWVVNPDEFLGGFSPVHGMDGTPLSPRTRGNANQLSIDGGDAGPDGLFSRIELRDSSLGNRAFTADMLLGDVVGRCRSGPVEPAVCAVLAGWDGKFDTTSVGAGLWREFIATFSNADLMDAGPLWNEPFDDSDPLGTPSGLSDDPGLTDRLTAAARALRSAGFDIDTPLGEMQRADRNGVLVPIHGGFGSEGVSNVVSSGANGTTSEAGLPRGDRLDGTALRTDGYPVSYGTSFIFDVEFTSAGPVAEALLTYGETGDPTSEYFADQTVMFSNKQWRPIRFTVADIESDPTLRAYAVGE